jgi:hypothetical protein
MTFRVIGTTGQTFGPVDLETLKRWASQSRVTPDMEIEVVEDGTRMVARDWFILACFGLWFISGSLVFLLLLLRTSTMPQ